MAQKKQVQSKYRDFWEIFDDKDKEIALYLAYSPSPVSLDLLIALSEAPAVKVLNVTEELKHRKVIYEKKGYRKGVYFLNGTNSTAFLQEYADRADLDTGKIIRQIIRYFEHSISDDDGKTLALAGLYRKLGDNGLGLKVVRRAAEILSGAGNHEAALSHYNYIIESLNTNSIGHDNACDFLDSITGKISIAGHLMSGQEQIVLLTKARAVARQFKLWQALAAIELNLGKAYQQEGDRKRTYQCITACSNIARKIDDQRMIRKAALLMLEFLFWEKQTVSEVISVYESVIGNLEEFEDDEATLRATARIGLCYVLCGRVARGLGMIDAIRTKATTIGLTHVSVFCDLMTVLSLLELRKIDEAKPYIDRISSYPKETLGHYFLRPFHACNAYVLCMNGDYENAFRQLTYLWEHSQAVGWMHHKGPWNFESMDILEKNGFFHQDMNYEGEIEKSIRWKDFYMRGVAYRYRAFRSAQKSKPSAKVLTDLRNSEKYLKLSGGVIELARTHIALGDFYLKRGEKKAGQSYLKKAWLVFSNIDRSLFPKDMLPLMPQEQKIEVMVDRIIAISESLSAVSDMSSFLERAINLAIDLTMATRGAFITMEAAGPTIVASRNLDPLILKNEQFSIINEIVASTATRGKETYMPGSEEATNVSDESLNSAGITSLICMPVSLGNDTYGYVYLDNRLAGRVFPDDSLPYLRLLCNQIAVGITSISTFEKVKHLKDRFEDEAIFYKREMGVIGPIEAIIGKSEGITRVIDQIRQVAATDSTVLILGETGVGKELVAKAIHNLSDRKESPFIPVNLAALPPELLASELFGHEKGAFTGANELHKGRFEIAHGGTIFLDEIGDLPSSVQVKLLRVLQEGSFERLGSSKQVTSDFRVIAATNKDLSKEVEKGNFREDLYYRLKVFPVAVPPLRERRGDIPLLAYHFLERFGRKKGLSVRRLPEEELAKLDRYHWPGNVRELEHFIERSVILCNGDKISFSGLENASRDARSIDDSTIATLEEMERKHIERTLDATHGRVCGPRGAAIILGLKPTTLFFRMTKLGIAKNRQR